jgi:hypothetical protein
MIKQVRNINVASDRGNKENLQILDFITISPFTGPYDADNLVKLLAGANTRVAQRLTFEAAHENAQRHRQLLVT